MGTAGKYTLRPTSALAGFFYYIWATNLSYAYEAIHYSPCFWLRHIGLPNRGFKGPYTYSWLGGRVANQRKELQVWEGLSPLLRRESPPPTNLFSHIELKTGLIHISNKLNHRKLGHEAKDAFSCLMGLLRDDMSCLASSRFFSNKSLTGGPTDLLTCGRTFWLLKRYKDASTDRRTDRPSDRDATCI